MTNSNEFTPREDARLVIRHRAQDVKALAVQTEAMGEHDEAQRLAETYRWLEAAAATLAVNDDGSVAGE